MMFKYLNTINSGFRYSILITRNTTTSLCRNLQGGRSINRICLNLELKTICLYRNLRITLGTHCQEWNCQHQNIRRLHNKYRHLNTTNAIVLINVVIMLIVLSILLHNVIDYQRNLRYCTQTRSNRNIECITELQRINITSRNGISQNTIHGCSILLDCIGNICFTFNDRCQSWNRRSAETIISKYQQLIHGEHSSYFNLILILFSSSLNWANCTIPHNEVWFNR